VAAQADIYDALRERLQSSVKEVPKQHEQLEIFEQNVQELTRLLDAIQGLDVAVKEFLQKVIDGQATMRDLTPDVRLWCQSGDRERIFRITITG
jgi:t-SNARE complex subunit (syntaxin)